MLLKFDQQAYSKITKKEGYKNWTLIVAQSWPTNVTEDWTKTLSQKVIHKSYSKKVL